MIVTETLTSQHYIQGNLLKKREPQQLYVVKLQMSW